MSHRWRVPGIDIVPLRRENSLFALRCGNVRVYALQTVCSQVIEQFRPLQTSDEVHEHVSKVVIKAEWRSLLTEKQMPSLNYRGQESWCAWQRQE